MKKSLRQFLFIMVSAVFMLLSIFPHHHHDGGSICVTMQVCHQDGRINDQHTRHCHNTHFDRHQLFAYNAQKLRAASAQDLWGHAGNWLLPTSFWGYMATEPSLTLIHHRHAFPGSGRVNACPHGRHWKRRGPPYKA